MLSTTRQCGVSRSRLTGATCRTLPDYHDIFNASDFKHPPQLNEYEFNPFLLSDPKFRQLREFEVKHNVVAMSMNTIQPSLWGMNLPS